jgi:NitT/TauT family transport system substrate-binding protein
MRTLLLHAALFLALFATPALAAGAPETSHITLAVAGASNFLPGYFAKDHGIFARHGLDVSVVVVNEGSTAIAGLMSDSFQFAGPTSTVFLQAVDSGLDVVVAAPAYAFPTESKVGILAAPAAHITSAKDMVGRKLGTPGLGGILDILAKDWEQRAGVDPAKVNVVELAFPLMADALRSGQVDAVIANEPVYPRLIDQHLAELVFDLRQLPPPGTIGGMYAATRAFVTANPNTLAAFRASLAEAIDAIRADPPEAGRVISRVLKMPPEVVALLTLPNYVTTTAPSSLDYWVGLMRQQNLISRPLDAAATIWP